MKRSFLFLLLISVLMISCTKEESQLEKNARCSIEKVWGEQCKYKMEKIEVIDTITYADYRESMQNKLSWLSNVDKSKFKKSRNREFVEFRDPFHFPTYEKDVMYGKLKDASPFCTELRKVTEKADSLLKVISTVKKFNYDYQYCNAWYNKRYWHFYGNYEYEEIYDRLLSFIKENPDYFQNTDNLFEGFETDIYQLKVKHSYSMLSPLTGLRVNLSDEILVDKDYNILESE